MYIFSFIRRKTLLDDRPKPHVCKLWCMSQEIHGLWISKSESNEICGFLKLKSTNFSTSSGFPVESGINPLKNTLSKGPKEKHLCFTGNLQISNKIHRFHEHLPLRHQQGNIKEFLLKEEICKLPLKSTDFTKIYLSDINRNSNHNERPLVYEGNPYILLHLLATLVVTVRKFARHGSSCCR